MHNNPWLLLTIPLYVVAGIQFMLGHQWKLGIVMILYGVANLLLAMVKGD